MLDQLGLTYMFINGSEESGIDVLRTKIKNFASTVSLHGGRKYLILDEADYLNAQSTQPALRGFIEEFHKNCGFILTCNYKNRLIPPLHSRCSVVDFTIKKSEKKELAEQFFKKVMNILVVEDIKFEPKAVAEVINKFFPDWRRVINELQRYSVSGRIDAGILVDISEINIKELMRFMKDKEFTNVRKWIVNNIDNDPTRLFAVFMITYMIIWTALVFPTLLLYWVSINTKRLLVADQEINMLACLTEIMARGKFK